MSAVWLTRLACRWCRHNSYAARSGGHGKTASEDMGTRDLSLAVRELQQAAREQHLSQMLGDMRSSSQSQARRPAEDTSEPRDSGALGRAPVCSDAWLPLAADAAPACMQAVSSAGLRIPPATADPFVLPRQGTRGAGQPDDSVQPIFEGPCTACGGRKDASASAAACAWQPAGRSAPGASHAQPHRAGQVGVNPPQRPWEARAGAPQCCCRPAAHARPPAHLLLGSLLNQQHGLPACRPARSARCCLPGRAQLFAAGRR